MGKQRLGKKLWFDKSLEVLAESGVEGIKIERLARSLGLSRNGFYWHFKNRDDLLDQLLDYWVHEFTVIITSNSELLKINAEKRLLKVMKMVRKNELAKYDLAMNHWAMTDPKVMKAVNKVTKMRLDFLRETFMEMGFKGNVLEAKTRLFVCYNSWQAVMFDPIKKESKTLQKELYRMFVQ